MRAEVAPSSIAEAKKDHHVSRHLPGSSAGPNKASHKLTGAEQLGIELGGAGDAARERAQAAREGDELPPVEGKTNNNTGLGMLNGSDQGVATPGEERRDAMQGERNGEMHKQVPDLAKIARTSAASSAHHPTHDQNAIVSSANRRPDELLDTAARSVGTESGTGAAGQDPSGTIEIGRDAPSGNVPVQ